MSIVVYFKQFDEWRWITELEQSSSFFSLSKSSTSKLIVKLSDLRWTPNTTSGVAAPSPLLRESKSHADSAFAITLHSPGCSHSLWWNNNKLPINDQREREPLCGLRLTSLCLCQVKEYAFHHMNCVTHSVVLWITRDYCPTSPYHKRISHRTHRMLT